MKSIAKSGLLLAAIGLTLTAGCGDSSTTSGETRGFTVRASTTMLPGKLSRPRYVAKIDEACRDAWDEIHKTFSEYTSRQDKRLSARRRLAQAIRVPVMTGIDFHIFDSIRIYGAPHGEESRLEAVTAAMQEAVERGQRLEPLYSAAEVEALFSTYNRRARAYGFGPECLVIRRHLRELEA